MYAVGNFEKYLRDHPNVMGDHDAILKKVKSSADARGMVSGRVVELVFDAQEANRFHHEAMSSSEHIAIAKASNPSLLTIVETGVDLPDLPPGRHPNNDMYDDCD